MIRLERIETGYAYPPLGVLSIRRVRVGSGSGIGADQRRDEWEVSTENATLAATSLGDVRRFLDEIEGARS